MKETHPPLEVFTGDDWMIRFSCLDSTGAPIDLAGCKCCFWKLVDVTKEVVLETDQTDKITVLTPTSEGRCLLRLPHASTETIAPGSYVDQLRILTAGAITAVRP